jgi:hypothetical protein
VAKPETRPQAADSEDAPVEQRRLSIGGREATLGAGAAGFAIVALALAVPQANPDRIPVPAAQPQAALTIPLPAAATAQDDVVPQPAERTSSGRVRDVEPDAAPVSTDIVVAKPADDRPTAEQAVAQSAEAPAVDSAPAQALTESPLTPLVDAVPADTAQVTAASAKLPLPGATIARTIQRIGYGCGSVVSTTAVVGADGVFKVTCSSGDAYRAAPVGGRYHFRRWGSH